MCQKIGYYSYYQPIHNYSKYIIHNSRKNNLQEPNYILSEFCLSVYSYLFVLKQNIGSIMGCTQSASSDEIAKPSQVHPMLDILPSSGSSDLHFLKKPESRTSRKQKYLQRKDNHKAIFKQANLRTYFEHANGDLDQFFNSLSQKISQFYLDVNSQILEMLNQHKLDSTQSKIKISERVLIMSLEILLFLGKETNYQLDLQVFKQINSTQKNMINYLQTKYPRGGKAFVPGDLMSLFKNFNMTEHQSNDILRNANIAFVDSSNIEIVNTIKLLFNTIIDELDEKFPYFQKFMQQKVFNIKDFEGNRKSLWFKIGRKIPETAAKYKINPDDEDLTITSPQIFRVIIKWVSYLQEYFDNPEQFIKKQSFKVVNVQDKKITFDDIDTNQIEDILYDLKNRLGQAKVQSKTYVRQLRNEMSIFNMNLLKILGNCQVKQKFIPENDAIVIKYASYNTMLVSWILAQKLIFLLKKLITISHEFISTSKVQLDLIKFSLSDLMRSMVKGSKKEILAVFQNIKNLEAQGQLRIIKIKNRLGTPLNDAMIIFKVKDSFLICELQLILSEKGSKSEKLKNIQFLNHFLYELERTPYGVMSESSVVMGFKDTRISYENNIEFEQTELFDLQKCQEEHPESVITEQIQKKPLICSCCTNFYFPFENVFPYKSCTKCFRFKCCKCIFSKNKTLEEYQIQKKYTEKLSHYILSDKIRSKDLNVDKFIQTYLISKQFFLKTKLNPRSTPKDFQKLIVDEEFGSDFAQVNHYQSFYFLFIQFKGINTNMHLMHWNADKNEIEYSYFPQENFYEENKVMNSLYDFIVFFKKQKIKEIEVEQAEKYTMVYISQKVNNTKHKSKKYEGIFLAETTFLVLKMHDHVVTEIDGVEVPDYEVKRKKQFKFKDLHEVLDRLPSVQLVKQNVLLKNIGIGTHQLIFFQNCEWKNQIRILNIADNKITNISLIFEQLPTLEYLFASKNFIFEIDVKKEHACLRKIICFRNYIKKIAGLQNLKALTSINLNENKIERLPKLNLQKLRDLFLNLNPLVAITQLQSSTLPKLENLFMASVLNRNVKVQKVTIPFPSLRKFLCPSNPDFISLEILSDKLEILDCQSDDLEHLSLHTANLKEMHISYNRIHNISEILQQPFPKLKKLEASSCETKVKFWLPQLNCPHLEEINFDNTTLEDISRLSRSNLPALKILQAKYTQIETIPQMSMINLEKINVGGEKLQSISELGLSNLPSLKTLDISSSNLIETDYFPLFSSTSIQTLTLNQLYFTSLSTIEASSFPSIKQLHLTLVKCKQFPAINMPTLKRLLISSCEFGNMKKLENSILSSLQEFDITFDNIYNDQALFAQKQAIVKLILPKIKIFRSYGYWNINLEKVFPHFQEIQLISLNYTKILKFPQMKANKLMQIEISNSKLNDISNLPKCVLPVLKRITLSYCQDLNHIPALNFSSLVTFDISSARISDLTEFEKSVLPNIEQLFFYSNQIPAYPALNFKKLKEIEISSNPIKKISGLSKCDFSSLQSLSLSNLGELEDKIFPVINFPSLGTLYVSSCNIQDFSNMQKCIFPNLESMEISYCKIQAWPLLKLMKLKECRLEGNSDPIQNFDLKDLTESRCPQLQKIALNYFKISHFPEFTLPKLKEIQLYNIQFEQPFKILQNSVHRLERFSATYVKNMPFPPEIDSELDTYIINNSDVSEFTSTQFIRANSIQISNCKLSAVKNLALTSTTELILYYNQIEDLSSFIKQSYKLVILDLSSNQIKEFPKNLKFPKLTTLQLSYNKIRCLSLNQQNYPVLKTLEFSNNVDNDVGPIIEPLDLPYLTDVRLRQNKIKRVNFFIKNIYKYPICMQLSYNQITEVDYMPECSQLNISGNPFDNFDWFKNVDSSASKSFYFNLSNCKLKSLSGLKYLSNSFQAIYINQNQHEITFDGSIHEMKKIYNFQIYSSKLTKFQNITDKNYPTLRSINLTSNKLTEFGKGISTNKLNELSLQYNQIKFLHPFSAKSLQYLYLSSNQIQDLSWIKKIDCPRLKSLALGENKIKKLVSLKQFQDLIILEIQENPLEDIVEFLDHKSLQSNSFQLQYSIKSIPKQFREKIVTQIKESIKLTSCYDEGYEEPAEGIQAVEDYQPMEVDDFVNEPHENQGGDMPGEVN